MIKGIDQFKPQTSPEADCSTWCARQHGAAYAPYAKMGAHRYGHVMASVLQVELERPIFSQVTVNAQKWFSNGHM